MSNYATEERKQSLYEYYRDEQKLKAYIATQEQAIFDQYKDEEAAVRAALKHAQDEQ